MTMEPVITLSNLNKTFDVVHEKQMSLKAAILFRRPKPQRVKVLRDVTLTINRGEAVAVIGRNGSGKSTLLGIIGRVYTPTSGSVEVDGRMFTMLDAGADAGFHPELTGRENIYFNGAIMGLKTQEITSRIDRIIEFSELGEFIDTAVKTYSAGMMMRLGFAIAVQTDPDVLLIDEALAVGDAAFQQKCYDRINEFKTEGRTIVFVTHDLAAAKSVATRAIWIDHGQVMADADPESAVAAYLASVARRDDPIMKEITQ
jgi:ABC-type polysaccharide/polyol phosphate transport system ATPase subunit